MKKYKASILAVTLIILSIILITALSISLVAIKQRNSSLGSGRSNQAFQSADTGVERVIGAIAKTDKAKVSEIIWGSGTSCNSSGLITGSEGYSIGLEKKDGTAIACNANVSVSEIASVKSIGTGTQQSRAVRAAVKCKAPYVSDADTVGLYHFQEENNDIKDSSASNNDGLQSASYGVKGTVPSTPGVCSARYFDGNKNNYIAIPDSESLQISGSMTVEAWARWDGEDDGEDDWRRIVGKGATSTGNPADAKDRNYGLWMYNGPVIAARGWLFQFANNSVYCNAQWLTEPDQDWHYLVGIFDDSNNIIKLYVDGVMRNSAACAISPATPSDPLTIGYAGFHDAFSGIIDEVRITNKVKFSSDAAVDAEYDKVDQSLLP